MKKVVLKVDLYDDRIKQKAMKTVSGISGVESVSVDMKDKKLTLMGDIDPVHVVGKLRKRCHTEILSVGPAKEEKKKNLISQMERGIQQKWKNMSSFMKHTLLIIIPDHYNIISVTMLQVWKRILMAVSSAKIFNTRNLYEN